MSHKSSSWPRETQQRRLTFAIIKKMTIDYSTMTQPAPVVHEFTETSVRIYLLSEYPLHTLPCMFTNNNNYTGISLYLVLIPSNKYLCFHACNLCLPIPCKIRKVLYISVEYDHLLLCLVMPDSIMHKLCVGVIPFF